MGKLINLLDSALKRRFMDSAGGRLSDQKQQQQPLRLCLLFRFQTAKEYHARVAQLARSNLRRLRVRRRNSRRGRLASVPGQPVTVEKVSSRSNGSLDRIQRAIELVIKARIYRIRHRCNQILGIPVAELT